MEGEQMQAGEQRYLATDIDADTESGRLELLEAGRACTQDRFDDPLPRLHKTASREKTHWDTGAAYSAGQANPNPTQPLTIYRTIMVDHTGRFKL